MDWLKYEKELFEDGYNFICGVDEAGRGPLAGPVFAAAVILPKNILIDGVDDSKKLSEKKREILFDEIKNKSISYNIAFATEREIDEINILNATLLTMNRAIEGLRITPDFALIDGDKLPNLSIDAKAIIKGDALSISIAAASILAKVSRDRYMKQISNDYPVYQFEKHKGYGTALHRELILKYGPSDIHRKSFLKKILKGNSHGN